MKSTILSALLLSCLACCLAFAQQPAQSLTFEVASIKPSEPQPINQIRIGMNADAGMLRYTNVSLKDCIRVAYKVKDFQIDGPDWLGSARFDITAKLPEGAKQDQVPEMLQALLAERFKLAVHRDSKEHAIYALIPGKNGPKLKPAEVQTRDTGAPGGSAGPGGSPPRGGMMLMFDPSGMHLKASSVGLAGLADALSRFTERPIVDMTDIKGQYDFDLIFAPETTRGLVRSVGPPPAAAAADGASDPAPSIYDAVQVYGLKLDPRKAPMDVLVIDHIEKAPTEN